MLQVIPLVAAGIFFPFFMTALGAATVFLLPEGARLRRHKPLLGFAAGVMTAASVWSLLLPALEQEGRFPAWLPVAGGVLSGAALMAALDTLLDRRLSPQSDDRQNVLLMAAITLHNVPEGMAVGLAFALAAQGAPLAGAAALALGVGIQNFPEGAAVALPLCRQGASRKRAFFMGVLSGAAEPVFGVPMVLAAAAAQRLMPWLLSFAAGAMLYVVAEELIPQSRGRGGTCAFIGGFLVMMVLDTALG